MWAIAATIGVILTVTALVHLYWALGGLWPANSPGELAQTVIGEPGREKLPPPLVTVSVAGLILAAGLIPALHLADIPSVLPDWLSHGTLWLLAFVFISRGAVTYLWVIKAEKLTEPFRTLNFRYFSPLCLILGTGFAILVIFS